MWSAKQYISAKLDPEPRGPDGPENLPYPEKAGRGGMEEEVRCLLEAGTMRLYGRMAVNIGVLIIRRIGFGCPLYYFHNQESPT